MQFRANARPDRASEVERAVSPLRKWYRGILDGHAIIPFVKERALFEDDRRPRGSIVDERSINEETYRCRRRRATLEPPRLISA